MDYLKDLKFRCENLGIMDFVHQVLYDERFATWSGSGNAQHHHYGDGGLLQHTYEVFNYADLISTVHNTNNENKINIQELLVSAIWHDYGKIWDYQKVYGVWGKHDNHARTIHHISRSVLEFSKYMEDERFWIAEPLINENNVIHNILAHHGRREWGSPVSPASKEAWILHLADNLSARLDDCEKCDILKH